MSHRSFRTALSMGALAALSCSVYSPSDLTGSGSGGTSPGGHGGAGESGTTSGGSGGTGGQNSGGSELGGAGMAMGGGTSGTGPKGGAGGSSGDTSEGGASGAASGGSTPTGGKSTATGGKSSGGSGGASGGSGGATTGGEPTTGGSGATTPPELIDDMEDGNLYLRPLEDRTGLWYTAADTASKSSAKGGMLAVTDSPATDSTMAFHFVGDGTKGWGAQAAFDLVYVGTAKKEPYDASKYKGIHFYAKAAAATKVLVRIPIVATTENATGSTCIPSSKSSTPTCEDHYTAEVSFTTSWVLVSLDWTGTTPKDFHQQGWGKADWDPSEMLGVQFAVDSACEFWIDDISFNK